MRDYNELTEYEKGCISIIICMYKHGNDLADTLVLEKRVATEEDSRKILIELLNFCEVIIGEVNDDSIPHLDDILKERTLINDKI